jgi:mRNA-degrading endonuclease toxin of MazEF toxin-antitoxin module
MAGLRLARGDIYLVARSPREDPKKHRPLVILSRQTLCGSKADKVVCASINTHSDGRLTEVAVGTDEGLRHSSVINCDQLMLIPKSALSHYVSTLSSRKRAELNAAIRIALDV